MIILFYYLGNFSKYLGFLLTPTSGHTARGLLSHRLFTFKIALYCVTFLIDDEYMTAYSDVSVLFTSSS